MINVLQDVNKYIQASKSYSPKRATHGAKEMNHGGKLLKNGELKRNWSKDFGLNKDKKIVQ